VAAAVGEDYRAAEPRAAAQIPDAITVAAPHSPLVP
jgi:hypothetical protein